ncbi:hypothetical protein ACNKHX_25115 [Shigella flexneri]
MVVAVIGLITSITMKETANRPLKGATPAASDTTGSEGKFSSQHYNNISRKSIILTTDCRFAGKTYHRLVQQHPRIDE